MINKQTIFAALALVTLTPAQAEIAYLAVTDGFWQVWVMEDDGTNPRQVTFSDRDKSSISWFPDGETLLVNGNDGLLRTLDVATGEELLIDTVLTGMVDAVVRPDGQAIAFSLGTSRAVADNNIWVIDIAGGNPQKLTQMQDMQHQPAWSRDGASLYFLSSDLDQAQDFWRLDLTQRSTSQLTNNSLYNFDLAFGPDDQVAFSSNRTGNYELWMVRGDDFTEASQLTNHSGLDGRPTWSPDGQQLAFESSRGGEINIWLLDVETGDLEQLTQHPQGARFPAWSPTSRMESNP